MGSKVKIEREGNENGRGGWGYIYPSGRGRVTAKRGSERGTIRDVKSEKWTLRRGVERKCTCLQPRTLNEDDTIDPTTPGDLLHDIIVKEGSCRHGRVMKRVWSSGGVKRLARWRLAWAV